MAHAALRLDREKLLRCRSSASIKDIRMVHQMNMRSSLYRLCMPSSTAPDETGTCLRETLFRALTCSSPRSRNATNFNLLDRLKYFLAARAACISQRVCEAMELYNQCSRNGCIRVAVDPDKVLRFPA